MESEVKRLLNCNEKSPFGGFRGPLLTAGCDEAGRGCLAGPVVAAAVILPDDFDHPLLNDSKKISKKKRDTLRILIEKEAVSWAVAMIHNEEIDEINILNASIKAMHTAIKQLSSPPEALLIDGNKFHPYLKVPHKCIIKGDSIYKCIAAASILAKTHRDEYMAQQHKSFPFYGWNKNKGYPTKAHRSGIEEHGVSPLHRRSFKLTERQIKLEV
ncbi:ribonuclease HII [Marinilabilia rubra]|uniref:Ribonuclease HII n=1 Tax=Marinilabilia rubra TaxID=2162893 RepID=A0A2U2B7U9_9BACT|nr:ribonuclease HII [Marinilabilia rubra]PWD99137.1 ribonuclease HII [Marinilabilia rubra]